MSKKRGSIIFTAVLILFFGSIFYRNVSTFTSMKSHLGYTLGTIKEVWDDDGSWYSRYEYSVNGVTFRGRQGEKYDLHDTVLIIYDTTKPRFSMIVKYPSTINLDSSNSIVSLDTSLVKFKWWDYLPGDEINSVKDLWCLD